MIYNEIKRLNKEDKFLLLIDYGWLYGLTHILNDEVNPKVVEAKVRKSIIKVIKSVPHSTGQFIICGEGKNNFRKQTNKEYKANRPHKTLKWSKFIKTLLTDKLKMVYTIDGLEADDTVNILHSNCC